MKSFILLTVLLIVFSCIALAQPPGLPHAPDQAPLDGGLALLAAAGGAYGWRKLQGKGRS
jgi:hypothetical protein